MSDPFQVVRDFESDLCEYTGAPYCVATTSCTMALLLALEYHRMQFGPTVVTLPKRTYVGVAQSVLNARHGLAFMDYEWTGAYKLLGTDIVDSARWLTSGMYKEGMMVCLSFHWAKTLGIGQGGCILHDNPGADDILRRMRFDGRSEDGTFTDIITPAYHAYMMPRDAAEGLTRLALLPKHNDPLPNSDYPDLSEIFK